MSQPIYIYRLLKSRVMHQTYKYFTSDVTCSLWYLTCILNVTFLYKQGTCSLLSFLNWHIVYKHWPDCLSILVNSLHGLLNWEIGGLDCHVITKEYRTRAHCLNCKCDVCSCLSQSEDLNPGVFYLWRQSLWKCMKGRVMKTDPLYLLVDLYQTITKVCSWKMVVRQIFSLDVYLCILSQRAARGSRNIFDILTKVMHLCSTWGLTCYWRIRGNEWCIVTYLR